MSGNQTDQINQLKNMIRSNSSQISNLNNSITKMQRAQESLTQFRKKVVNSKSSVQNITQNQNRYLAPVKELKSVSKCAKNYSEGMSKTLSGFGTKLVAAALQGLLLKIDIKLRMYQASISAAKASVNQLKTLTDNHNSAIRQLEKLLKEAEGT